MTKKRTKDYHYGRVDVAKDDDFLSDTLLANLVSGARLEVHHAWGHLRSDTSNQEGVLEIVRDLVTTKTGNSSPKERVKEALLAFAGLSSVKRFLRGRDGKERAPFFAHANRYLQVYLPSSSFEFVRTKRYSWHTNKAELAVVATRTLPKGEVVSGLCGVLVMLTKEDDEALRGGQDFSVVVNVNTKKIFILLGPARFVNHDCEPNVRMKKEGKGLRFETIRAIKAGEEILSSYGENYFGDDNRECLCATCERNQQGMFDPNRKDSDDEDEDDDDDDEVPEKRLKTPPMIIGDMNERKTRRGTVFSAPVPQPDSDEEEEEEEGEEGEDVVMKEEEVPDSESIAVEVPKAQLTGDDTEDESEDGAEEVIAEEVVAEAAEEAAAVASVKAVITPKKEPGVEGALTDDPIEPFTEDEVVEELATPELQEGGDTMMVDADVIVLAVPDPSSLPPPVVVSEATPGLPLVSLSLEAMESSDTQSSTLVSAPESQNSPQSPPGREASPALSTSSSLSSSLSEVPDNSEIENIIVDAFPEELQDDARQLYSHADSMSRASRLSRLSFKSSPSPTPPPSTRIEGLCDNIVCRAKLEDEDELEDYQCYRCTRHLAIFRVHWPHRTGERLPVPKQAAIPIWSCGRPPTDRSSLSREPSTVRKSKVYESKAGTKRKAKATPEETPSSRAPPQKKRKTEAGAAPISKLSKPSPLPSQRSSTRLRAKREKVVLPDDGPESEEQDEVEEQENDGEEESEEESEEEAPIRITRSRSKHLPPPESSSSLGHSRHGRPLRPSTKAAPQRTPTPSPPKSHKKKEPKPSKGTPVQLKSGFVSARAARAAARATPPLSARAQRAAALAARKSETAPDSTPEPPKRPRGRPRKYPLPKPEPESEEEEEGVIAIMSPPVVSARLSSDNEEPPVKRARQSTPGDELVMMRSPLRRDYHAVRRAGHTIVGGIRPIPIRSTRGALTSIESDIAKVKGTHYFGGDRKLPGPYEPKFSWHEPWSTPPGRHHFQPTPGSSPTTQYPHTIPTMNSPRTWGPHGSPVINRPSWAPPPSLREVGSDAPAPVASGSSQQSFPSINKFEPVHNSPSSTSLLPAHSLNDQSTSGPRWSGPSNTYTANSAFYTGGHARPAQVKDVFYSGPPPQHQSPGLGISNKFMVSDRTSIRSLTERFGIRTDRDRPAAQLAASSSRATVADAVHPTVSVGEASDPPSNSARDEIPALRMDDFIDLTTSPPTDVAADSLSIIDLTTSSPAPKAPVDKLTTQVIVDMTVSMPGKDLLSRTLSLSGLTNNLSAQDIVGMALSPLPSELMDKDLLSRALSEATSTTSETLQTASSSTATNTPPVFLSLSSVDEAPQDTNTDADGTAPAETTPTKSKYVGHKTYGSKSVPKKRTTSDMLVMAQTPTVRMTRSSALSLSDGPVTRKKAKLR